MGPRRGSVEVTGQGFHPIAGKTDRRLVLEISASLPRSNDTCRLLLYPTLIMKRLRVLVADDNDTFRCIIVELLCNSYQVIGAVCDGDELIQSALCLDPDVVVSNILMPGMDGLAAREMLIAAERAIPFVFVSELGKELLVLQFPHNQSPVALVYKSELWVHLSIAVAAVLKGQPYLSPYYR